MGRSRTISSLRGIAGVILGSAAALAIVLPHGVEERRRHHGGCSDAWRGFYVAGCWHRMGRSVALSLLGSSYAVCSGRASRGA